FNLPSLRHGPVEERIETRDALACCQRFDVFEKRREAPYHTATIEILRNAIKRLQRQAGLGRPLLPQIAPDLFRHELALERGKDLPFDFAEQYLLGVLRHRELF